MRNLKRAHADSRPKKRDIDLLLKPRSGPLLLVELKFNDDHDTGKRPDIFRKVLHTADGLRRKLHQPVVPLVCYFNSGATSDVQYLPSGQVLDGRRLFSKYADIRFDDVARAVAKLCTYFDDQIRPLARDV
jgi:Trm5-related predicted tRNA methylase